MTDLDKISKAGQKAIINIAAGQASSFGLVGRSQMGGHISTMASLERRGYVYWNEEKGEDVLTEKGENLAVILAARAAVDGLESQEQSE